MLYSPPRRSGTQVRPISNLFSKENRQITHNSIFADFTFQIRFCAVSLLRDQNNCDCESKTKLSKIDILLAVQSKTRPSSLNLTRIGSLRARGEQPRTLSGTAYLRVTNVFGLRQPARANRSFCKL